MGSAVIVPLSVMVTAAGRRDGLFRSRTSTQVRIVQAVPHRSPPSSAGGLLTSQ
jgi:hypothetical protein